jgi:hypothetical protein
MIDHLNALPKKIGADPDGLELQGRPCGPARPARHRPEPGSDERPVNSVLRERRRFRAAGGRAFGHHSLRLVAEILAAISTGVTNARFGGNQPRDLIRTDPRCAFGCRNPLN